MIEVEILQITEQYRLSEYFDRIPNKILRKHSKEEWSFRTSQK
jgi:hypothetical protein